MNQSDKKEVAPEGSVQEHNSIHQTSSYIKKLISQVLNEKDQPMNITVNYID